MNELQAAVDELSAAVHKLLEPNQDWVERVAQAWMSMDEDPVEIQFYRRSATELLKRSGIATVLPRTNGDA